MSTRVVEKGPAKEAAQRQKGAADSNPLF